MQGLPIAAWLSCTNAHRRSDSPRARMYILQRGNMTIKDKLEIGLKPDAPYRKDNLPDAQVRGPEIPAGPDRSPIIPAAVTDTNIVPDEDPDQSKEEDGKSEA